MKYFGLSIALNVLILATCIDRPAARPFRPAVRRSINRKPDDRISDQASPIMRRSFVLIMSESLVLPRFMLARMLEARLSCSNYEDEPSRDFHAVDPRLPIAPRGVAGTHR